jgi:hypothetical protein
VNQRPPFPAARFFPDAGNPQPLEGATTGKPRLEPEAPEVKAPEKPEPCGHCRHFKEEEKPDLACLFCHGTGWHEVGVLASEAAEVVRCLWARDQLAAGFEGMGLNIVQERAARLRPALREFERALARFRACTGEVKR